jgi:2-hydroxy-3-keto-5-methylthiopentenyl-1-phosphate phosphatase
MANVLCLDFDDTIVLDNISEALIERFATADWHDLRAAYQRGEMSVEQYNAAAFDLVGTDITYADMRAFVREATRIRPGVLELVDWAHWNGWLVAIVSNGFDFAIDEVLGDLKLDRIVRHAGRTRFDYRWRVRYLSPRGIEVSEGFKLGYAAAFRRAGDFVAYVGDGASDVDAAKLAPSVFARDTLWARLKDEHHRIYPFETFHDVVQVLEREAHDWLESFSSTTAATD